ncbi:hypothetical protein WMY93_001590 [Mugilogobius chulae]|uniref:Uncharacterized protein n=1 Tax=Mugilogobius chulae TaxID=88201 RepID=A0AAW0Q2B8_9GOBI
MFSTYRPHHTDAGTHAKDTQDGDESFGQIDVGILLVNPEGVSPPTSDLHPASLKTILEGEVVVDKLKTLPDAVCLLFALTYGLHLNYPKKIQNTLQFIQQCIVASISACHAEDRGSIPRRGVY